MAEEAEPAEVAQDASIEVILESFDRDEIDDLDVTATFEDDELTLEVYLHVEGVDTAPVVTEAIERGTAAVDELLE